MKTRLIFDTEKGTQVELIPESEGEIQVLAQMHDRNATCVCTFQGHMSYKKTEKVTITLGMALNSRDLDE